MSSESYLNNPKLIMVIKKLLFAGILFFPQRNNKFIITITSYIYHVIGFRFGGIKMGNR